MTDSWRPRTPPSVASSRPPMPITPEQVRRMEESRLKAKALRTQQDAASKSRTTGAPKTNANYYAATTTTTIGQKRPYAAISSAAPPATARDARNTAANPRQPSSNNGMAATADTDIHAARKFQKFVEYDFSKMTDTKGGFMTAEDDPHNRTLHAPDTAGKPANMTVQEWERNRLQRRLRDQRAGPFEPGLSVLDKREITKKCRECGSLEIDWQWEELLHCCVCHTCKDKFPEKYSLLTKTEAKEDYLLTDPELRDETLLPHIEKANPHKSTWNNMMLYLRFQVEEYAFSEQKWGSAEALDEEFTRRQTETKARKEKKFKDKLMELKKRTRVDAYKRARGGGGGEFGDTIGNGRHEHEWGRSVEDAETGMMRKSCVECGMEVEELEF